MHARIIIVPDLALALSVAVAGVALSLTGYAWDGWSTMPVAIRFAAGLIVFGLSPGLLIAGPLLAGRSRTVGPADFVISVFTCSFSCNLIFNIVLFLSDVSFADLAHAYVVAQALGYVLWGAWAWRGRRERALAGEPARTVEVHGAMLFSGLVLTIAAAALTYIAYANGPPPVNPEELVSLRKLAENPTVRYDNLFFRNGDPSTYLFVPFQILIVGTSLLAHLDVVLTYSLFWGVTTALSIAILTRLAFLMFGRAEVAAVVCLTMILIGFFDPRSVIFDAGIVTPYPNRYGFGSGVLLPLCLVLFWSILRDPRTHIWRWALLTYLVIETTFVHARETILAMGAMAAVFVLLAARGRQYRAELLRIAGIMAVIVTVLLAYKYVNLSFAPQLDAYVSGLSSASRDAAARMIEERGLWSAMVAEAPGRVSIGVDATTTVDVSIARYQDLFVATWNRSVDDPEFLGRLYLPLVLLLLPVYALRARSIAEASLALVLAGLGVITASGPLELWVAAVVGNPEVFVAYNLIFVAALFVFGDVVDRTAAAIARLPDRSRIGTIPVLLASAALPVIVFTLTAPILEWRAALGNLWTPPVAWFLITASIAAIGYRFSMSELPLVFRGHSGHAKPLPLLAAGCIAIAVMIPTLRESVVWRENPFTPEYPSSRFTGDLVDDYDILDASNRLDPVAYPVDLIRFFRESLPPNQTVLSRDTLALALPAPHFGAVVSSAGRIPPSFIANSEYLRAFARREDEFAFAPYFTDEEGRRLFRDMLQQLHVDIVIVDPAESTAVRDSIERHDDLRAMLQPVFESEGFLVYRSTPSTLTP